MARPELSNEHPAVSAARSIAPLVVAESEKLHRAGRLTEPLLSAMAEADLWRVSAPSAVGGGECDFAAFVAICEELGRADLSTAWCFVQANASSHNFGARLAQDVAREIFATPSSVVAAGFPVGQPRAESIDGGYRVTGEWAFASGCLHASWFDARALVFVDGAPVREGTGLFSMASCVVPLDDVEIVESWDVTGMRGTGSHHYVVDGAFVPADHSMPLRGDPVTVDAAVYQIPSILYAHVGFASMALGAASAALDDFVALATGKTAALTRQRLCETAVAQDAVGRNHARLRAGFAHRDWAVADATAAAANGPLGPEARIELRLAASEGLETALTVIDHIYRVSGTTGIFVPSALHRRFQDIHVLGQQLFGRPSHFENVGRALLGLEYDHSLV
jgi:alkylation response protein AidB-like acyl-CoA dehydrogenase